METTVRTLNSLVVSITQMLALFVISIGITKALIIYLKHALFGSRSAAAFQESRLELGYSFSLGLGVLIGASILKTTLAPTWNDIGKLGAIIAIRTILNYLLLQTINTHPGTSNPLPDKDDPDHLLPRSHHQGLR